LPEHQVRDQILIERLDATTRTAAAYLFPKERALVLLTLLFCSAEIQLLDDGSGPREVAVIHLASIELFAREHQGWSKDTMLRYLTVLEALQILSRKRKASYTELHVPLVAWSPNAGVLSALDGLLQEDAKRAKLQQLAGGVRERFLLLYGSPSSGVRGLLKKRLSPTKRQLLQIRVKNLKAQLEADAKREDFRTGFTPQEASQQLGETPPIQSEQRHSRRNEARVIQFHNKHAETVALPATLTLEAWKITLEYFHHKCADFQVNDYQVLEHFIPLTSGGGTTQDNCVPACGSINSIKGDQDPRMLSSSSHRAGELLRIQNYLKTRKTVEEVDS
jgi:hypothetical protein